MGLWSNHRLLFTDGWNSFWHVMFGMMTTWFWWISPIFIVYQLIDYTDPNLWIDLSEFFFGWFFTMGFIFNETNDYPFNDVIFGERNGLGGLWISTPEYSHIM